MRQPVAFLVHPRTNVAQDLGMLVAAPLARIPNAVYERAFATLPLPPLVVGEWRFEDAPGEVGGWLINVPLTPRQLLHAPRELIQARLDRAVDRARRLGARLVGLGALTAPASRGGETLTHHPGVGITNGNALTAAVTLLAVERLISRCPPHATLALVGASGSVGTCLTHLLARRHDGPLLLVARHRGRLDTLARSARRDGARVTVSTEMSDVRGADLVVLLTSAADALLGSEHLKPGAIVLDDTQPRNTDPALVTRRPDVLIVDGGLVEVPGMRLRGEIGLPRGVAYACLAETMLLGLSGHSGHFAVGAPTPAQAEHMLDLARAHAKLGFGLARLHAFGRPLSEPACPPGHARPVLVGHGFSRS